MQKSPGLAGTTGFASSAVMPADEPSGGGGGVQPALGTVGSPGTRTAGVVPQRRNACRRAVRARDGRTAGLGHDRVAGHPGDRVDRIPAVEQRRRLWIRFAVVVRELVEQVLDGVGADAYYVARPRRDPGRRVSQRGARGYRDQDQGTAAREQLADEAHSSSWRRRA